MRRRRREQARMWRELEEWKGFGQCDEKKQLENGSESRRMAKVDSTRRTTISCGEAMLIIKSFDR